MKVFEKKETEFRAIDATNISFLYFPEIICNLSEYYVDIFVKTSWYNANSLVNKGNCLFIKSNFTIEKEIYLEFIDVQADYVQEIYNLGLATVRLGLPKESSQAFEKLLTVVMNNIFYV